MSERLTKAVTLHDGHPDPHYPSWGFGHLVRVSDGPRIGRLTRVFHTERLPIGTSVSIDAHGGLPRVAALLSLKDNANG